MFGISTRQPSMRDGWFVALLWLVFACACVAYAALAADYLLGWETQREPLWIRMLANLVSGEYALGEGSVHVMQRQLHDDSLTAMRLHTLMGAVALALGPSQFLSAVRARFPRIHRHAGRMYIIAVCLSVFASLSYLAHTPFAQVFSGTPFALALLGLELAVLATLARAVYAIMHRDFLRHRAWMAINFALLLATPGLRLGWLLCGWVRPELNHTPAILGVTTLLIPACLTAVLLWLSLGNKTPAGSYVSRYAPFLPWYRIGLTLNAIVALAMLWMTVLRFIPLASDWSTIDLAGSSADTQLFARAWPLYAVYWLACAAALLLVPHALRRALKRGDLSASFIVACTGTAVFGVLLNTVRGDAAPGGPSMAFFWYGLAVLWLIALARMIAGALAAQRSTTRDWAVVNVALALLPVSVLPSIPLWSIVADLDLDRAIVTAATASFALHYLVAHWFTTDVVVLKRKTPRARSALALGGATSAGA